MTADGEIHDVVLYQGVEVVVAVELADVLDSG